MNSAWPRFAGPSSHAAASFWLAIACLALFLPGFFAIPPTDRDESRFAQATKQMVASGDYVNIRFQSEPRNKKPVGIYWLQAAAARLSGFGEQAPIWVYRLPSLLGAIAAVLLTYWALLPLFAREDAFLAALLFASCILLGVEARLAKTDAVLLATTTAAFGALLRVYLRQNHYSTVFLFWLALAAGFLVKGPLILLFVGGALLTLSVYRKSLRWLKDFKPLWGIPCFLALVAPWFTAILVSSKGAFLSESLGRDMLGKVAGVQENHGAPPGTYLLLSLATFFPASVFLAALAPRLKSLWRDDTVLLLAAWIVPSWIVLELVPTKLPHYVLPLYPAIAGLTICLLRCQDFRLPTKWQRFSSYSFIWVPALVLSAAFFVLRWREGVFDPLLPALLLLAFILGCVAVKKSRSHVRHAIMITTLIMLCVNIGVYQRFIPRLSEIWLSPRLAEASRELAPCPQPILSSAGYHEPSLVFLAGTGTVLTDGVGAAHFLQGEGCRLALVEESSGRGTNIAEAERFTGELQALSLSVRKIGTIEGRSVNGGHLRRIGIWSRE